MKGFISARRTRTAWSAGAATVLALAATASLAFGQAASKPDGGQEEPAANPVVHSCGAPISSTVITQNSPSTTKATSFEPLPGATTDVHVPAGASRCVKLLFTAETACGISADADYCYVRAMLDNAPMDPNGAGFQAIDSEDGTASGHAYEWVKRVGPGAHVIRIDRRVGAMATAFYTDDWTMDVETTL